MKNTTKDKVKALLKRDDPVGELCRNNDNFLILYYILEYHSDLDIALNFMTDVGAVDYYASKLPALSELKRYRAYFQNKMGLYLANTEIKTERHERDLEKTKEYSTGEC